MTETANEQNVFEILPVNKKVDTPSSIDKEVVFKLRHTPLNIGDDHREVVYIRVETNKDLNNTYN
jgi:hypothetical protein